MRWESVFSVVRHPNQRALEAEREARARHRAAPALREGAARRPHRARRRAARRRAARPRAVRRAAEEHRAPARRAAGEQPVAVEAAETVEREVRVEASAAVRPRTEVEVTRPSTPPRAPTRPEATRVWPGSVSSSQAFRRFARYPATTKDSAEIFASAKRMVFRARTRSAGASPRRACPGPDRRRGARFSARCRDLGARPSTRSIGSATAPGTIASAG